MSVQSIGGGDVRLMAQRAMQEAAQAQEDDLRAIIDEISGNAAKKAEIREIQGLVRELEQAVTNYYDNGRNPTDFAEMAQALTDLRSAVRDAGYGTSSSLYEATISPDGTYGAMNEGNYFDDLNAELDAISEELSDIGDSTQVSLQMAMTTLNTAQKTASDILKAWGDNLKALANNIKP